MPILQFDENTKTYPAVLSSGSSSGLAMPSPADPEKQLPPTPVVAPASVAPVQQQQQQQQPLLTGKNSPARAMSHISGVRKPTLTHTNSLTKLPRFGIETPHEEELEKIFDNMDKWGIDLFQVSEYSNRHPLTAIMYTIFRVCSSYPNCSNQA